MRISLKDDINSVDYFHSHFDELAATSRESKRPLVLTQDGKAAGVFLDIETWQQVIRKINLLKMVYEGEASLKEKEPLSLEEVEETFNKKYGF